MHGVLNEELNEPILPFVISAWGRGITAALLLHPATLLSASWEADPQLTSCCHPTMATSHSHPDSHLGLLYTFHKRKGQRFLFWAVRHNTSLSRRTVFEVLPVSFSEGTDFDSGPWMLHETRFCVQGNRALASPAGNGFCQSEQVPPQFCASSRVPISSHPPTLDPCAHLLPGTSVTWHICLSPGLTSHFSADPSTVSGPVFLFIPMFHALLPC